MQFPNLRFHALIPSAGFRWVYRDERGIWDTREPPEDWAVEDYRAAEEDYRNQGVFDDDLPVPELTDRFYLAASNDQFWRAPANQETRFGQLLCEPDLYMKFASAQPTPATILDFANQFGLLRSDSSITRIGRKDATVLFPRFDSIFTPSKGVDLTFMAEKAFAWLYAFRSVRNYVLSWENLDAEGSLSEKRDHLEDGFNQVMGGSLTYQVKMDPLTGATKSEVIATSLADYLNIQWGMSIAAHVLHRQCSECPTWYALHPGSGRPEKKFCSDACRMRAFRRRQKSKKRHG